MLVVNRSFTKSRLSLSRTTRICLSNWLTVLSRVLRLSAAARRIAKVLAGFISIRSEIVAANKSDFDSIFPNAITEAITTFWFLLLVSNASWGDKVLSSALKKRLRCAIWSSDSEVSSTRLAEAVSPIKIAKSVFASSWPSLSSCKPVVLNFWITAVRTSPLISAILLFPSMYCQSGIRIILLKSPSAFVLLRMIRSLFFRSSSPRLRNVLLNSSGESIGKGSA